MVNTYKKIAGILLVMFVVVIGGCLEVKTAEAGTSELSGWAWSSASSTALLGGGWISFNSKDPGAGGGPYAVIVSTSTINSIGDLSGWAWSSNIGWIRFGGLSSFPTGGGTVAENAKIDFSTGKITGWARACSGTADGKCGTMVGRTDGYDGWISLSGTNHTSPTPAGTGGLTLNPTTGAITGYTWGSNVLAWMIFDVKVGVGTPTIPPGEPLVCNLETDPETPPSLPLGGDTVTVEWSVTPTIGTTCTGIGFPIIPGSTSGSPDVFVEQNTGFTLSCSNSVSSQMCSRSKSVTVATPSSGTLKLRIGATEASASISTKTTYQTRVGLPFALAWKTPPAADGYSCIRTITKPDGSSGNSIWTWDGSEEDAEGGIPTTGLALGKYDIEMTCTKNSFPTLTSSVELSLTKSRLIEQ